MRYYELLSEGPHDPHTHKAIFMLGGPGSGKTHVANKLIGATGLRPVNVDSFYEMLRNRDGIVGQGFDDELYKYSGSLLQKRMDLLIDGRLGLLVDGTGRNMQRIIKIKERLEGLGYDTMAVFVNTDINIALNRNEMRRRMVDPDWLEQVHDDLGLKLGDLQRLFGSDFLIVDNSEDHGEFAHAQKQVDKFVNRPNRRPKIW